MDRETIAHYEIREKLGSGGMGEVYRAKDTRLNRYVAIKTLPSTDESRRRRFMQEAQTASALNHPNIVTIFDISHDKGVDFIVMELVSGKTLSELIGRNGLSPDLALRYAAQIADAVSAAHVAGIVHRDLKPGNVMVTPQGLVKVLDFGVAKLTERSIDEFDETRSIVVAEQVRTEDGRVVGTAAYMSPEQAQGHPLDGRSDIFSLGVVLYEMLTGQRPFQGQGTISMLTSIIRDEPKPPSEMVPAIPVELERLVSLCLRKDPGRRFQHMDDVKIALEQLRDEAQRGKLFAIRADAPARPPARRRFLVRAGAALLLIGGVAWWATQPAVRFEPQPLQRLTWDPGFTGQASLSPDGKLLAFASDRAGEGNLDIWVQQVAGGEAIRLTRDPADDQNPVFSPDGSHILYLSDRSGGGIYVISALGGEERLLVPGAYAGCYSPDGTRIAYWTGTPGDQSPSAKLFVMPANGGVATQLAPAFADARYPLWAPDARHLLMQGIAKDEPADWWLAPLDGGAPVRTGAFEALRKQQIVPYMEPEDWLGDDVYFAARKGTELHLWSLPISSNSGRPKGPARQLTYGTGMEAKPSLSLDGRMVFTSLALNKNIWMLPTDAGAAQAERSLRRITEGGAEYSNPSISAAARTLVYLSNRSGFIDIWTRDLRTARERPLTLGSEVKSAPVISADGTKIAYAVPDNGKKPIYVVTSGASIAQKICEDCGNPMEWSPDGSSLLFLAQGERTVNLLNSATGAVSTILSPGSQSISDARFSPDGRWLAFVVRRDQRHASISLAPFRQAPPLSESEWQALANTGNWNDKPCWSRDGNAIYFYSTKDNFGCLFKQQLDARKRPFGAPQDVLHLHSTRLSVMHVILQSLNLAVDRDALYFPLLEVTSNVWMTRAQH